MSFIGKLGETMPTQNEQHKILTFLVWRQRNGIIFGGRIIWLTGPISHTNVSSHLLFRELWKPKESVHKINVIRQRSFQHRKQNRLHSYPCRYRMALTRFKHIGSCFLEWPWKTTTETIQNRSQPLVIEMGEWRRVLRLCGFPVCITPTGTWCWDRTLKSKSLHERSFERFFSSVIASNQ